MNERQFIPFELEHGYSPCPLIFKSQACGYVGPISSCDKTFDDCRRRNNEKRFQGAPIQSEDLIEARRKARVAETLARWRAEDESAGR